MTEPDFPMSEYEQRLARIQACMRDENLDALFFSTEAEIRYFTGFRTLFWQSPTRPWYLVVPGEGKPISIIPEIGAVVMANTWIDDIRCWSSPHENDDGLSMLTDVLKNYSNIGMLMGRESSLRMPLTDFTSLGQSLSSGNFVDVSGMMTALRMIKSEAEIKKTLAICDIASKSFDRASGLFFEGQQIKNAFRDFKIDLLSQGAEDVPYLVGGAGQSGYVDIISPPSDTPLQAGDVFMLDTGACLQGYFCDFDRNYAIGHASDEARWAYDTLYLATTKALEAARPGVRCCDLFDVMNRVIGQGGSDVGRFGHGLGMQLTEGASLISFDETVLTENMVITLEPSMIVCDNKMMVHEENIVIRNGPAELLSKRAAPELPII
jgi:Xaa-Pro dipeptidase